MPTFTPPTGESFPWAPEPEKLDAENSLLRFYGAKPVGETVWQDSLGVWHQQQYPWHGATYRTFNDGDLIQDETASGLKTAQHVFMGGHIYEISEDVADELVTAGFGAGINSHSIELTWDTQDLDLLSNQIMTVQGSNIPGPPTIVQSQTSALGSFLLQSGQQSSSNRRDFWLHDHTSYWTDSRVFCASIAPLGFGGPTSEAGLIVGGNCLPQGGACLRFQNVGGRNRAVAINNNIFLGLGMLNVGVWSAAPDGTDFLNRQQSFDFFENPPFPYGFEVVLNGSVADARVFPEGDPDATPWTHSTRALKIDLDTVGSPEAIAANPTPVGQGKNGVIAAHLGLHPLTAVRLNQIEFEQDVASPIV